jgi:hypothetical protein
MTVTRLIIDDSKTFTKLDPQGVEYARSCKEGLFRLKGDDAFWDEIWLDFDLGDGDAKPIINLLETYAELGQLCESGGLEVTPVCKKIITCSMNPDGRKLIKLALGELYEVVEIQPWEYL